MPIRNKGTLVGGSPSNTSARTAFTYGDLGLIPERASRFIHALKRKCGRSMQDACGFAGGLKPWISVPAMC